MKNYSLDNADSLDELFRSKCKYKSINIDAVYFSELGLLRHALKYALFKIEAFGQLKIYIGKSTTKYGTNKKRILAWQIKHEIAKCIGQNVDFIESGDDSIIEATLTKKLTKDMKSITFGIICSATIADIKLLINQLESIETQSLNNPDIDIELIIVGPTSYDSKDIKDRFSSLSITYVGIDIVDAAGRALVNTKKKYIFQNSKSDILVIAHTRISFSDDFLANVFDSEFEAAAPQVQIHLNGVIFQYLDYVLIGDYDLSKKSRFNTLNSLNFGSNYKMYFKRRVPYIDGGVVIFNKLRVITNPYNEYLAWGEAEDVEMCSRLYYQGYLIDYLRNIKCTSNTNKLSYRENSLAKLFSSVTNYIRLKLSDWI
jgi:hypothetical protein